MLREDILLEEEEEEEEGGRRRRERRMKEESSNGMIIVCLSSLCVSLCALFRPWKVDKQTNKYDFPF